MKYVKCVECGIWFHQKTRNKRICSVECENERKRRKGREYYDNNRSAILSRKQKRHVEKEKVQRATLGKYVPLEERQKTFDHLDKIILQCGGSKAYEEKRKAEALAMLTPIVIPEELLKKTAENQKV